MKNTIRALTTALLVFLTLLMLPACSTVNKGSRDAACVDNDMNKSVENLINDI